MLRIRTAFLLYIAIAAVGVAVLDGKIRQLLLIFIAGLAVKTWVGYAKQKEGVMPPPESTKVTEPSPPEGEIP